MPYIVNFTDKENKSPITVFDNTSSTDTSLKFPGRNVTGYGQIIAENFLSLLENFASTSQPVNPVEGQLWYDSTSGTQTLKIWDNTAWKAASGIQKGVSQPSVETSKVGELWVDTTNQQLRIFTGTRWILVGPVESSVGGLRYGPVIEKISDSDNLDRFILTFYIADIPVIIFSKDSFTPKVGIIGFNGNIEPGFNAGTLSNFKIRATCINSDSLGGAPATTYVRTDTSNSINGQLQITSDLGITVGSAGQANLFVSAGDVLISNAATDRNIQLSVRKGITQEAAITINAATRNIDLYSGFTNSTVVAGGDLIVNGNLTVEGTTTTINTTTVAIEDKNIVIANVVSPTNITADGAGITIKASTDKTITYNNSSNWLDISETLNLAAGRAVYIGGTKVIDGNSLGSAITSIPGVSSFGTQTVVNIGPGVPAVTQMRLENHRISTVSTNFDIELEPDGSGNVALIGSPRITGMQDPVAAQDAATKEYTDNRVESRPVIFTIDLSDGKSNTYIITNILNNLAPVSEYRAFTYARILCNLISNNAQSLSINSLPPSISTAAFLTNLGGASSQAITNISFPTATIAAASVSVTRIIKVFRIIGGVWTWQSDLPLPP